MISGWHPTDVSSSSSFTKSLELIIGVWPRPTITWRNFACVRFSRKYANGSTVSFHSIRQGLLPVTSLLKFWFRHFTKWPWHSLKILAVWHCRPQIFLFLACDLQMNSAPDENGHYLRDISAILEAPWRVTAELNEMVQYSNMGVGVTSHHITITHCHWMQQPHVHLPPLHHYQQRLHGHVTTMWHDVTKAGGKRRGQGWAVVPIPNNWYDVFYILKIMLY